MEYSQIISESASKSGFETFLKIIENPCLDPKYRPEIIRNRQNTAGDKGLIRTCPEKYAYLISLNLFIFFFVLYHTCFFLVGKFLSFQKFQGFLFLLTIPSNCDL